jgi:cytochrome c oxidase subunit II
MPTRLWQSALAPAGAQAARIADHAWFLIGITTAVGLLVLAAIAWAAFRGRRRAGEPPMPAASAADEPLIRSIGYALAATVAILFAILVASFHTGRAVASLRDPSPLVVTIAGHQFWWEVRYEDPIPSLGVTAANELHIPVGRPVELHLTSHDVVHSFWVPQLHGKRDLIPGYVNTLWIQADRTGAFQGQCAEYCGRQHAHMALMVIAHEPADFVRWLEAQRQPAAAPVTESQRRGQQVFLQQRCSACHTIQGTGANGLIGPDLSRIGARTTLAAGTLPNNPEMLARWIANPQRDKPGNQMPATPLPPGDLADLVAYLGALK